MGLVIIVILLTLGLLLVVQFVVLREPSDIRTVQTESQLAANFLNTMLQATTDCSNRPLRNLLQNCASANDIQCETAAGAEDACTFVNRTIQGILDMTLINWSRSFNLTASNTDTYFPGGIGFSQGDCTGARESKFYPLPAAGQDINVRLDICRRSTI
jgi:hypothetical protein